MFHVKQVQGDVSRETMDRLQMFTGLLVQWNRRINLVGRAEIPQLWSRHIADSLQLIEFIPQTSAKAVDLGSGAGFPGLILAIATGRPFHLIESDKRKAAFLREAARLTETRVIVEALRIENSIATAPLITARALAPLRSLLDLAVPHLEPGGFCLFPKGGEVERELTEARAVWNMHVERHQSRIDPQGCILRISEVSRV